MTYISSGPSGPPICSRCRGDVLGPDDEGRYRCPTGCVNITQLPERPSDPRSALRQAMLDRGARTL